MIEAEISQLRLEYQSLDTNSLASLCKIKGLPILPDEHLMVEYLLNLERWKAQKVID